MFESSDGQEGGINREPKKEVDQAFGLLIGAKEKRKLRARKFRNSWIGFGVFGLVGWSVAIPTLLGIALGVWLDARHPGRYSWTLMLLIGGLGIGCLNAWHWVSGETESIRKEEQRKNNHD